MEQTSVHSQAIVLISGDAKAAKTRNGKECIHAFGTCLTRGNGYKQKVCLAFYARNMDAAKLIKTGDVVFAHGGSSTIVMTAKSTGKPYGVITINVADWINVNQAAEEMRAEIAAYRSGTKPTQSAAAPPAEGEADEVPF